MNVEAVRISAAFLAPGFPFFPCRSRVASLFSRPALFELCKSFYSPPTPLTRQPAPSTAYIAANE